MSNTLTCLEWHNSGQKKNIIIPDRKIEINYGIKVNVNSANFIFIVFW